MPLNLLTSTDLDVTKVVQLTVDNKLPAVDGSLLTNLPAGATTLDGVTDTATRVAVTPAEKTAISNNTTVINTRLQTETQTYLANVIAAGGYIGASALASLDKFVARAKSGGYLSLAKELWIPLGDFAASKIKLISTTTWTFNNIVATDYSQETGYIITSNSTKYISTGFIPDNQGLNSKNISIAFATTEDVAPTNFGRVVGTATGTGSTVFVNHVGGRIGVGSATIDHSFGHQGTCSVGTWGATKVRGFLNGTWQQEFNSEVSTMPDEINIFRGYLSGTMYYANGSLGFYGIFSELTQAQAQDLNLAMMDLMRGVRTIYSKVPDIIIGDSISAGTGAQQTSIPFSQWSKVYTSMRGTREQNNSQGNSKTTLDETTSGARSFANRYAPLLIMPSQTVAIIYGTNDIAADGVANGDATLSTTYFNNLTSKARDFIYYGHKVVMGSPPNRPDTNDTKMTLYVSKAAAAAKDINAPFADLYHAFTDYSSTTTTYLADGLHPNYVGHRIIGEYMYYASLGRLLRKPTLDVGSIAAQTSVDTTVLVYNAIVGMQVVVTPPATLEAGLIVTAFVSANDTVTIRLTNITGSAIDPASGKYTVFVYTNY